jgi:hypothetical protein
LNHHSDFGWCSLAFLDSILRTDFQLCFASIQLTLRTQRFWQGLRVWQAGVEGLNWFLFPIETKNLVSLTWQTSLNIELLWKVIQFETVPPLFTGFWSASANLSQKHFAILQHFKSIMIPNNIQILSRRTWKGIFEVNEMIGISQNHKFLSNRLSSAQSKHSQAFKSCNQNRIRARGENPSKTFRRILNANLYNPVLQTIGQRYSHFPLI